MRRYYPAIGYSGDVLKSERGRRNAAKRKTFGARRKGQPAVWRRHNPNASCCRCSECLVANLRTLEEKLESRIQAQVSIVGVEPTWAKDEIAQARKKRAAVEWAILEHQLDDLEANHERAA